jgi:hypothetical protein
MLTIEQSRRYGDVALASETVAHRANVVIDAKDLLNDDDAALGRSAWLSAVGAELETIRSDQ